MSVEIKVPSVGESITEGVLARWLKKDGEAVHSGDPLFELETDKATQEVTSPADGVLSIAVKEGTTVTIGSVVGQVDPQGKPAPRRTDGEPAAGGAGGGAGGSGGAGTRPGPGPGEAGRGAPAAGGRPVAGGAPARRRRGRGRPPAARQRPRGPRHQGRRPGLPGAAQARRE